MNQRGVTLIETLVALAILGLIATAFLIALTTTSKATFTADERATALSLAQSQIEYVKSQDYIDYSVDPHDVYNEITPPEGEGYSISFTAVPFDPVTGLPYGQTGGIFFKDDDIQKITVTIKRLGREIITLEAYKAFLGGELNH